MSEIAKKTETGMVASSRPAFLKQNDTRGTEHLTKDDLQMPRLALAQKMSPEVEKGNAKQIKGLEPGHLFNSLTGQNFGEGPIRFTVLRADPPRYVEFNPLEEGGGIKDPDVPANDPRTKFGPAGEVPVATKFYDFIIAMLPFSGNPMENVIALSLKSTGLKTAKQLNALMKWRNAPTFAGAYELVTASETKGPNTYSVYKIRNADAPHEWVTEEEFQVCEQMFTALKDKPVAIHREEGREPGDETDFPPVPGPSDDPSAPPM